MSPRRQPPPASPAEPISAELDVRVQTPSPGRIVRYRLTELDADRVNEARRQAGRLPRRRDGAQVHNGNTVAAGDELPMFIVRVWPNDSVNGQVFLDGNDVLWVTSAAEGGGPGTWSWPERDTPLPPAEDVTELRFSGSD